MGLPAYYAYETMNAYLDIIEEFRDKKETYKMIIDNMSDKELEDLTGMTRKERRE